MSLEFVTVEYENEQVVAVVQGDTLVLALPPDIYTCKGAPRVLCEQREVSVLMAEAGAVQPFQMPPRLESLAVNLVGNCMPEEQTLSLAKFAAMCATMGMQGSYVEYLDWLALDPPFAAFLQTPAAGNFYRLVCHVGKQCYLLAKGDAEAERMMY